MEIHEKRDKIQHWFIGRLCKLIYSSSVSRLTDFLDRGNPVDLIYLALSKAFDTVYLKVIGYTEGDWESLLLLRSQ